MGLRARVGCCSADNAGLFATTPEGASRVTGAKRPGRPWATAKGPCTEINDLVGVVRSWLDEAALSVPELHDRLVPDHFHDGVVPPLRKLRDRLAGDGLTWDLVEAVADSCFHHEPQPATDRRLAPARSLWEAAESNPTVIAANGEPAVSVREVFQAQERALNALEELNRVRQAYETSERARNQALQVATILFNLLGQAQAQISGLTHRLDALTSAPGPGMANIAPCVTAWGAPRRRGVTWNFTLPARKPNE